jgi:hypothetical protein
VFLKVNDVLFSSASSLRWKQDNKQGKQVMIKIGKRNVRVMCVKPDAKSYSHFSRWNRFFKPIGSLYLASMCLLHICIRYVIFCYSEICNFFCCCCIFCYVHILFISDFRFMLLGEICKKSYFSNKAFKNFPHFLSYLKRKKVRRSSPPNNFQFYSQVLFSLWRMYCHEVIYIFL